MFSDCFSWSVSGDGDLGELNLDKKKKKKKKVAVVDLVRYFSHPLCSVSCATVLISLFQSSASSFFAGGCERRGRRSGGGCRCSSRP